MERLGTNLQGGMRVLGSSVWGAGLAKPLLGEGVRPLRALPAATALSRDALPRPPGPSPHP